MSGSDKAASPSSLMKGARRFCNSRTPATCSAGIPARDGVRSSGISGISGSTAGAIAGVVSRSAGTNRQRSRRTQSINRCQRLGVGCGDGGSNSTLVDRHCLSASSPSLSRSKSALRSRLCANHQRVGCIRAVIDHNATPSSWRRVDGVEAMIQPRRFDYALAPTEGPATNPKTAYTPISDVSGVTRSSRAATPT